jgi:hypothetical protein
MMMGPPTDIDRPRDFPVSDSAKRRQLTNGSGRWKYHTTRRPTVGRRDVVAGLSIRGLAACDLTPAAFPGLIDAARRASSMKGNPIELGDAEIGAILGEAG